MFKILRNASFVLIGAALAACSISFENNEMDNATARVVSGNMVSNGDFNNGTSGWHLYTGTGAVASMSVANEELVIDITASGSSTTELNVSQAGLTLAPGKAYIVSFRAKANRSRPLLVAAGKTTKPWIPLYSCYQRYSLTTSYQRYTYAFTMTEPRDTNSAIGFQLGYYAPAMVYIDDVVVKEIQYNQITNGNFNSLMSGWEGFVREGTSGQVGVFLGPSKYAIVSLSSGDEHPDPWDLEILQTGLKIRKSRTYVVSFEAWANSVRDLRVIVALHEAPWTAYSNVEDFSIQEFNPQYNHLHKYSFTFTMEEATDFDAYLAFQCGGEFAPSNVYIDNVVLAEVNQLLY